MSIPYPLTRCLWFSCQLIKFSLLTFTLTMSTLIYSAEQPQIVTYVEGTKVVTDPYNNYFIELLLLALDQSVDKFGPYQLQPIEIDISQKRQVREIQKGRIDVFWTMTSYSREASLLPVKFPLAKGMYGLRLLAINANDTDLFSDIAGLSSVKAMKALAAIPALSGRDWPDTPILRLNRFTVVSDVAENKMYPYLSQKTGYYFPRGIVELFSELQSREEKTLINEPRLALMYPAVIYFFVSKQNPQLAERLEYGLNKAKNDGSFDRLFYGHPRHDMAFKRANLSQRIFFKLKNPLFPKSATAESITLMQEQMIKRLSDK
ncbi:hypothetical protein [Shewanella frigidimarina]|uniref:hypothetical protein n=1 Tax=Shewanella frigidimarina TaxID=56812 RepID=UPI003D7AB03D